MIVLGPDLLKLLKFQINNAYFFRVIPFKWCENKDGIYRVKPLRWNPYKFNVFKYVLFVHQLFILVRLGQSFHELNLAGISFISNCTSHIPDGAYVAALFISCITQFACIHQSSEIETSINQLIVFAKSFQGLL